MKLASIAISLLLAFYPRQPIQVDVQLQQVTAVVRDSSGRFVRGLKAEDFILEENGERQDIARFEEESAGPISLGIFLDNCWDQPDSASAVQNINRPPAPETNALLGILGPQDEVSLMGCSRVIGQNELVVYEDFTGDRRRIERHAGPTSGGIADGRPGCCPLGATRFEVIERALESMKKARKRKRVMVIMHPSRLNVATIETESYQKLLDRIARFEVPVYLFGSGRPGPGPTLPLVANLATESGGGSFQFSPDTSAPETARSLEADIRAQYSIGFYLKPPAPPSAQTIRARTRFSDHRVTIRRSIQNESR